MCVAFAGCEFASDGVRVRKMVHAVSAAFQNDFLVALKTSKRPVAFPFEVCSDGLPVRFPFRGQHEWSVINSITDNQKRILSIGRVPEGLESALKTAIGHAIQADPKPGWVRASTVPSRAMVENLEKRIAELENNAP